MSIVLAKVYLAQNVKKTISNIVLPIILERCSGVLISTSFYQQKNDVVLNITKIMSVYQPF